LRNLLGDYVRKIPIDLRTYVLPFIYGLLGGLGAVALHKSATIIFLICWENPSQQMSPGTFAFFSLATILVASIIVGLILTLVSPDAGWQWYSAGKSRLLTRFSLHASQGRVREILCRRNLIGGDCSLGREGPTVPIAGALASNIAGWLGVAKRGRRPASPDRCELQRLCDEHPYQKFPLVMNGQLLGLIDRNEILNGQSAKTSIEPADAVPAHATIREAVAKMVGNSRSLLVVPSSAENVPNRNRNAS
jgi:hypothetical protein